MSLATAFSDTAVNPVPAGMPLILPETMGEKFSQNASRTPHIVSREQIIDGRIERFWKRYVKHLFPEGYRPVFLPNAKNGASNSRDIPEVQKLFRDFWSTSASGNLECVFIRNDNNLSSGGFVGFTALHPYHHEKTLRPLIIVRGKNKDGSLKAPEEIEGSLIHEMVHRGQLQAAIMHADLSNSASPVVLSPRDKMRAIRYMEGHAASLTAFLALKAAEKNPNFYDILSQDALSVREFQVLSQDLDLTKPEDVKEALRRGVIASMNKDYFYDATEPGAWTYGDYYMKHKLQSYLTTGQDRDSLRLSVGEKIEYVRIKDENDIISLMKIGNGYVPNPFEERGTLHADFREEPPFKPEIEEMLAKVEAQLGIKHENLRGFNEALDDWGMSGHAYTDLANGKSRSKRPRPFPFQLQATQPCVIKELVQEEHAEEMREPDWSEHFSASPS